MDNKSTMDMKSTEELEHALTGTHATHFDEFLNKNKVSMQSDDNDFSFYMKDLFVKKKLTQQLIFLRADIPERYGYKLLSGERKTKQRDVILRICYAAEFSLEETQTALKKYRMAQLYAKIPRDALLMIAYNERPGDIMDVNELLESNGFEILKTCGVQE